MAFDAQVGLQALVREQIAPDVPPNTPLDVNANHMGDLFVAQGMPERTEIVRQSRSWQAQATAATASVAALPTTAAQVSIWNGEEDDGLSYVIDLLVFSVIAAGAAAQAAGLMWMLNKAKITTAPSSGLTPRSLNSVNGYGGKAIVAVGTSSLVNDGWCAAGTSWEQASATSQAPGPQRIWEPKGLIVIRPGRQLNLQMMAQATTVTGLCGVLWHETRLKHGA